MDSFDVIKCLDDCRSTVQESVCNLMDKIENLQCSDIIRFDYFQEAYKNVCHRVGITRNERISSLRRYYSSKTDMFQKNAQNDIKKSEKHFETNQRHVKDHSLRAGSVNGIQKDNKDVKAKLQQCADTREEHQHNDSASDRVKCIDNQDERVCSQESPKTRSIKNAPKSFKKWFSGIKFMKRKKTVETQVRKASKTEPRLLPHLYLDFNHRLCGYEPTSLPGIIPLQMDTNPSVFLVKKKKK